MTNSTNDIKPWNYLWFISTRISCDGSFFFTVEIELTLPWVSALMFGQHKLKKSAITSQALFLPMHINLHYTFVLLHPQTLTQTHNTSIHTNTSSLFSPVPLFVAPSLAPPLPPRRLLPCSPLLILPSLVTAHCQQRRIRSISLACC